MMNKRQHILAILEEEGVLRARELAEHDISPEYLNVLAAAGVIQHISRGVYAHPELEITEHFELMIVQKRVPHGVFCLLTALQFHGMTTQIPRQVNLAIERGKRAPQLDWPPLDVFHISESQFDQGIEEHELDSGPTLRVYSPARTVADCFKFRNRIGIDVAIEALRDYRREELGTIQDLLECAAVCRVKRVIRPYLEAIL